MANNHESFDVRYVKGIVSELSDTTKKQADTLNELKSIAIETKILLEVQSGKQRDHTRKLDDHSVRIRAVERDSGKMDVEIGALRKGLNRLLAFKDMITSRADEDSKVIDVHATRMKAAVNAAMTQQLPYKVFFMKMLPWLIVVFACGIAIASIITFKALTGNADDISVIPDVDLKTNLSSQRVKK